MRILVRVTETLERGAAAIVIQCRKALAEAEEKLAQLLGYRDEYVTRLKSEHNGLPAAQVRAYHVFLAKLNDALVFQREQVARTRSDYERKRHDWSIARRKAAAADKLATRERRGAARLADAHEQYESDDRSQHHDRRLK